MTLARRRDPYHAYNFLITLLDASAELASAIKQIERMTSGGFSECSGLESTVEIEEYKEGGNNGASLKFATRGKTTPLVLKRGITTNDDLWAWHNAFVLGRGKRLFRETARPSALRLIRSQVSTTGVVMSTYVPDGDIRPGSFPDDEPGEKELARRKKMANERQ